MEQVKEFFGAAFGIAFGVAYMFSGLVGALYWAVHKDLINVVLSIFIPMYGAISVLWNIVHG